MPKCTERIVELKILEKSAEKIRSYARLLNTECYGSLLGNPQTKIIEDAYLYWGQRVSPAGVYISDAWAEYSYNMFKRIRPELKQLGWWHSHASMHVFDSSTDLTNTDQAFAFESCIVQTDVGQVSYLFYVVVNRGGNMKAGVKARNLCGFSYQDDVSIVEMKGGIDFTHRSLQEEIKEKVFPYGKAIPPDPKIKDSPLPINQLFPEESEPEVLEEDDLGKLVELTSKYNLSLVGYTKDSHNTLKQAASKYGGILSRPGNNLIDAIDSLTKFKRTLTYRPKKEKKDG